MCKFHVDRLSRFGEIFLTDTENGVWRKTRLKFWEPITLCKKILQIHSYLRKYFPDAFQIIFAKPEGQIFRI